MSESGLCGRILELVRIRRLSGRDIAYTLGQTREPVYTVLVSLEARGVVRVHSQGDGNVWWEMA